MSLDLELAVPDPYHLHRTLIGHQMGRYDPSLQLSERSANGALNTPEGSACFEAGRTEGRIQVSPGRQWLASRAMGLFGLVDDPYRFDPRSPVVRRLWRQSYGMHRRRWD